jgi:hypothetical protein
MSELGENERREGVDGVYRAFLRHFGLDRVNCAACVRARLPSPFNLESYSYTARGGPTWTWDVGFAHDLVARRQPYGRVERLEPEELAGWLQHHGHVDEQHLAHIPPEQLADPVLLAPVPDAQGQVLIDGAHRAAARIRAGLPVCAYLLTDEESAMAIAIVPLTMELVREALRARGLLSDDLEL